MSTSLSPSQSVLPPMPESALASARQFMTAYAYSDREFARICALLHKHAGIYLAPSKKQMAFNRLVRLVRDAGSRTFAQYLDEVDQNRAGALQPFLNALTTNVTSFFRERHHFQALVDFLRARPLEHVQIWSAGCSSGQEVWSIAMAMDQAFGARLLNRGGPFILGSDIDTEMLVQARAARYRRDQLDELEMAQRTRYFEPVAAGVSHETVERHASPRESLAAAGSYKIRAPWRQWVDFKTINLATDNLFGGDKHTTFDAIFCRNVMIYFDPTVQRQVAERLHRRLKPDGLLFVGHSESLTQGDDLFVARGQTCFTRREPGT